MNRILYLLCAFVALLTVASCAKEFNDADTGGGAVEREENRAALKDCLIIYLERSPENILSTADLSGRPLLQDHTLQELYERRREMYAFWAEVTTDGTDTEKALLQILSAWREATCVF